MLAVCRFRPKSIATSFAQTLQTDGVRPQRRTCRCQRLTHGSQSMKVKSRSDGHPNGLSCVLRGRFRHSHRPRGDAQSAVMQVLLALPVLKRSSTCYGRNLIQPILGYGSAA